MSSNDAFCRVFVRSVQGRALVVVAALVGSSLTSNAIAAPIAVAPNSLDVIVGERQVNATATGYYASAAAPTTYPATSAGAGNVGVGGGTDVKTSQNTVVGFLLPTLTTGQSIGTATLQVQVVTKNVSTMNIDVYGLGATDPSFSPDGTEIGLYLDADTDATQTKIANNAITASNTGTLPANIQVDVTSFLQGLYTGTTPTGNRSEAFFRLNPDTNMNPANISRYTLNTNATTFSLTLDVVPEPSVVAIAACGGLLLLRRQRRA